MHEYLDKTIDMDGNLPNKGGERTPRYDFRFSQSADFWNMVGSLKFDTVESVREVSGHASRRWGLRVGLARGPLFAVSLVRRFFGLGVFKMTLEFAERCDDNVGKIELGRNCRELVLVAALVPHNRQKIVADMSLLPQTRLVLLFEWHQSCHVKDNLNKIVRQGNRISSV